MTKNTYNALISALKLYVELGNDKRYYGDFYKINFAELMNMALETFLILIPQINKEIEMVNLEFIGNNLEENDLLRLPTEKEIYIKVSKDYVDYLIVKYNITII